MFFVVPSQLLALGERRLIGGTRVTDGKRISVTTLADERYERESERHDDVHFVRKSHTGNNY